MWEVTTQRCDYQELGIIGTILGADYHSWLSRHYTLLSFLPSKLAIPLTLLLLVPLLPDLN